MAKDIDHKMKMKMKMHRGGPIAFSLFTAWIGALVYFVKQSVGFWGFIVAVLKSIVWPAYVLYHVMSLLRI